MSNKTKIMKNKSDRILVTGGGGYIGYVATKLLANNGFEVKVVDTFYWGREILGDLKKKIEILQQDIRDITGRDLKDVNSVVHTAGLSNDPMADFNPKANLKINHLATVRLAKLCKKNGIEKFIFASSASIYDTGLSGPNIIQSEDSEVVPRAPYSVSKLMAEGELLKLKDNDFCPVVLRQGTVYGFSPRMRYDLVVNTMLKDAIVKGEIYVYCKGKEWRPLIDVTDVARAYVAIMKSSNQKINGQTFNLVYKNYNILDLARIVKKVVVAEKIANPRIIVDGKRRKARSYQISGNKIKKILGWQPEVSVEESVGYMLTKIRSGEFTNYNHPRFYNIEWMKLLINISDTLKRVKRVF